MVINVRMSGGEKDYKELMNKFELVSNAFLNLDEGYLSLPSLFSVLRLGLYLSLYPITICVLLSSRSIVYKFLLCVVNYNIGLKIF